LFNRELPGKSEIEKKGKSRRVRDKLKKRKRSRDSSENVHKMRKKEEEQVREYAAIAASKWRIQQRKGGGGIAIGV